jgi:LuxR family transcriptional regulator, maltose regulon positive regulatory protein
MSETRRGGGVGLRSPRFPSSKFCPPREMSRLVHRSRLLDELDRGDRARLTLVAASPGAGKTTLLIDWLAAHPERPSLWVTCDPADADPARFFAALVEGSRRATHMPDIGEDALQLLSVDGEVSADVVAALADDLERAGTLRSVVIDDFHLTGLAGSDALGLLIDYRPPGLQLIVATRVDPQLRLHRMRLNKELVELRDHDLSFSQRESQSFLEGLGVQPSEQELAVIHQRSEGWAAGLQMAAISIQRWPGSARGATRLEPQRHTVAGYFLEEVLAAQPPEVVDFMLATSILEELSIPACTALCGQEAAAQLQHLRTVHLFVTEVDDHASTYGYHPLIRDVLQAELHQRDPGRERRLHETAGRYLADAGQVSLAAAHLLAGGDPAAAFDLLSQRVIADFVANPVLGSALDLTEIQPELFAGTPAILVPLATELYLRGAFDRGRRALVLAQQTGVDPDDQPDLAVQLAVINATYLGITGQLTESLAQQDWAMRLGRDVARLGERPPTRSSGH